MSRMAGKRLTRFSLVAWVELENKLHEATNMTMYAVLHNAPCVDGGGLPFSNPNHDGLVYYNS